MNGYNSNKLQINGLDNASYAQLQLTGNTNKVLYTDSNSYVQGLTNATGYLYSDGLTTYTFKTVEISDVDFGLTADRVVMSDASGKLTSSIVSQNQIEQLSTNAFSVSNTTENLYMVFEYSSLHRTNFVVQQYSNLIYTDIFKINLDNCYIKILLN